MVRSTQWVTAFCSVLFDVNVGQKVESVVPHSGVLSKQEQSDIAFHAFPDSVSQELRVFSSIKDSCFFFRIRRNRVLYCFVFCRQRHDERLVRGVDRRAVVVVSLYPFSGVLKPLCQHLGPTYFAEGFNGMDRIYEQVLSWPDPQFHRLIKLELAGYCLRSNLPPFSVFPPPAPENEIKVRRTMSSFRSGISRSGSIDLLDPSNAIFHEVDVFLPFQSVLNRLWFLWEMVLTNQPLVIVAPTPVECSNAVAALISLITPIPFGADFRPYFTIQDPEFQSLIQLHDDGKSFQDVENWRVELPCLLGITNLYFIKVLSLWPNVLSIGERPQIQNSVGSGSGNIKILTNGSSTGGAFRRFSPKSAFQSFKSRAQGAQVLLSTHTENLWSQKKALIKPDLELCKELTNQASNSDNSMELRLHFHALTSAFLDPFKGYFVPVEASLNGTSVLSLEASGLPEFDRNEFLSCIGDWPFPNIIKNRFNSLQDLLALYENFIRSQNFQLWFRRQQRMIAEDLGLVSEQSTTPIKGIKQPIEEQELDRVWNGAEMVTRTSKSTSQWDCSDEVRLVEEFWRLHSELMNEMHDISTEEFENSETTQISRTSALTKTEKEFILVFSAMPEDLRGALLSSPAQINFVRRIQQIPDIKHYLRGLPSYIF